MRCTLLSFAFSTRYCSSIHRHGSAAAAASTKSTDAAESDVRRPQQWSQAPTPTCWAYQRNAAPLAERCARRPRSPPAVSASPLTAESPDLLARLEPAAHGGAGGGARRACADRTT
jgi:hypothetical protein